jgi:hypothetical protein
MKTRFLWSLFACVLAFSSTAYGQAYSFKVLVNKGKNEVKEAGGWQQLKVGSSLTEKDEIKLSPNSYLGLVHVTGKPLEVKDAKTHKVSDLSKLISGGSSVITKYTDFILSKNESASSRIGATGAVDRGGSDIVVYLPEKADQNIFYHANQAISWDDSEVKGPYTVTFSTLFGDELKRIETSENYVVIHLNGREFQNEDNIIVRVASKSAGRESKEYTLKRVSKHDKARIETLLKDVSASINDENALTKYILAGFYEENKLFIDAASQYREAIRLSPDPGIYQQYFNEFLLRSEIKKLPAK